MALQQIVEQTVTGLGYDLVEIERSAAGLLRITIDLPWQVPEEGTEPLSEAFVTVEDCEKVTRQLQFALEVDGVDYSRLEISSPGIDRPLRHELDFVRFKGAEVDITLKEAIGAESGGWQIVWSDEPPRKPGQRVSKKREPAPLQALGFMLDELREARLAPIVSFKGRAAKPI